MGFQAVSCAFILRWLEGNARGFHHSTDCLHFELTDLDTESLIYPEGSDVKMHLRNLYKEGLTYLENVHIIEHQQEHGRRLQMTFNLLNKAYSRDELLSTVDTLCESITDEPHSLMNSVQEGSSPVTSREVNIRHHSTGCESELDGNALDNVTYIDGDTRLQLVSS